jgi:glycerol-3-phosphate O-acyltransferase
MARKNKIYPQLIPNIEDWPINRLYQNRADFINEINEATVDYLAAKHGTDIEKPIARAIYLEMIRLKENPWKVDPPNERQFWKRVRKELSENAKHREDVKFDRNKELLRRIINRYSSEIAGNFKPKTFKFARKFLTGFFRRLLNTAAGRNHQRIWGSKFELYDRLHLYGDLELLRKLWSKGTIVVVPTHSSNLDSILIGYALDMMVGLPSFSYGAGLNLYDSEMIAYYMNRLGAYRVDRRKRNALYHETLKTMSQLSIEKGTNSIFFPGGTRSRSGEIEQDLKLGLMNSLISAQRSMMEKKDQKKVIIVPLILSYHFVLEAKYLINQHLKYTGEEKLVAARDDFQSGRKVLSFAWQTFSKGSEISLSFGKPMDVFGNLILEDGSSVDDKGQEVDIRQYFDEVDSIAIRNQREFVYTKILASKIVQSYLDDNVVLPSQIVAYVGFVILRKLNDDLDIFGLIRLPFDDFIFDEALFESVTYQVVAQLKKMEADGKIVLPDELKSMTVQEVISSGISKLGVFHIEKPLRFSKKGKIVSDSFKFLYFYHNRLTCYHLDRNIVWDRKLIDAAVENIL